MTSVVQNMCSWVKSLQAKNSDSSRRARLGVEKLEDRQLPSASALAVVAPVSMSTVGRTAVAVKTIETPASVNPRYILPVYADPATVADGYLVDAAVRKVEHDAMKDGSFSRQDLLNIFATVEQDGKVTANELQDLRTIVFGLGAFPMAATDRNLASKVVYGDQANQWWTGGATAVPLGNLQANDSGAKLDHLVGKWFLGRDHPALPTTAASDNQTYVKVDGDLFGKAGPTMTDVRQGSSEDCYFLASLAATAQTHPEMIQNMIRDNHDGTFTVRFYKNGVSPDYVTVDRYLPERNDKLFYARSGSNNSVWVALIEKAYVQWNESGASLQDGHNAYKGIDFGMSSVALNQIQGVPTTDRVLPQVKWADDLLTGARSFLTFGNVMSQVVGMLKSTVSLDPTVATILSTIASPDRLLPLSTVSDMVSDFRAGKTIVLCSSKPADAGGQRVDPSVIAPDHCVVLSGVSADGKYFNIYNQATGNFSIITREQLLDTFKVYSRTM